MPCVTIYDDTLHYAAIRDSRCSVWQHRIMKNELPEGSEITFSQETPDWERTGTRGWTNSHCRPGPRNTDKATATERMGWTAEQQAARESVLEYARFKNPRHRRIYRLHVAGLAARAIGGRVGMHARNVEHVIAVYDRQGQKDAATRLQPPLCGRTMASWQRYVWGQEDRADRPAIEAVLARLRELPAEQPSIAHLAALPRAFRLRWRAAGLSEASRPADVLKAARSWPELAECLRASGLLGDPFKDAATLPAEGTSHKSMRCLRAESAGTPCSS